MPDVLSTRERAVLRSVCETFQPTLARAEVDHLLDRVSGLIGSLPNADDRARLRLLLRALGLAPVNLAMSGKAGALDRLSQEARAGVLRGWANSRIQARRAGFQALKRLVNVAYYAWPEADGSHRAWRDAGYPGPLTAIEPPRGRLPELRISGDTTLDCDVVICGSGAGGGVAAGVLAAAGRNVVVLEKGPNLGPADFTQVEGDMLGAGYLDGGLLLTRSGSLPILAGSCVGGGTTVNWTTSFPLPGRTRAEWDALSGLSLFAGQAFGDALDRVAARSGVNTDNSQPGPRDRILERGLAANGWQVGVIPRNAEGCTDGRECGYCGYGCRVGAKRSTDATYLADATTAGARLIARCEAERIVRENGRAAGVTATVRTEDGGTARVTVRARAVVVACGALHTPALLLRSGLVNRRIGRGLRLHPVTAVVGRFDERVEPWSGNLQTRYSDQFADLDDGYGAKFETGPVHFALPASAFGWDDPASHAADVHGLANLTVVGILLRDRDSGRVVVDRAGRPRAEYELSAWDAGHLRSAMRGAAQVLASAGARDLMTLQQPPARVTPGPAGWLGRFMGDVDRHGLDRCRMALISFHQMGTAAMGADPSRGAVGETGEAFELPGCFVADGSAFPTSSGVNPMLTIMAIADHVARAVDAAL